MRLAALLLAATLLAAADGDPALPGGVVELHGRLQAEGAPALAPFWARIHLPDPRRPGIRRLELVWEPPAPAALGGTVVSDCPFALLDGAARVLAWDNRDGLSSVASDRSGYQTVLTRRTGTGDDWRDEPVERRLPGPRGWDRRLAPLLLAAVWSDGGAGRIPVVDLFGEAPAALLTWSGRQARLGGGLPWSAVPGPDGRLQRLSDGEGRLLLVIDTP